MIKILKNTTAVLILPLLYFLFISAFSKEERKDTELSPAPVSANTFYDTSGFVNMIQNMDYNNCHSLWIRNLLHLYGDSLGYNAVHVYPSDNDEYGTFEADYTGDQIANNEDLIDAVYENNLKLFYEQVKFSYLCYAQRITYLVHKPGETNQTNNGFCFQTAEGNLTVINDTTILEVQVLSTPDYTTVCGDIYENLQHSDYFGRQQDKLDWYVKPMVKLDVTNLTDNTPVFDIVFFNFLGESIPSKTITIYARNFKNQGIYNGDFTDKYFENGSQLSLMISGNENNTGLNYGRTSDLNNCAVDFKIYTYGLAHFWIKKLTVDDKYANELFNNLRDSTINDELSHVGYLPELFSYYMDEVTYSQLPCIKYVMDKVSAAGCKFMVSESNWMATHVMRNHSIQHKVTLDWLKPRILNVFAYEFWGDNTGWTYIPAFALNSSNIEQKLPSAWKTTSYNAYNNYLQTDVLGSQNAAGGHESGAFIYQIALAKKNILESSSPGTMMYVTPQMQGEMKIDEATGNLVSIREPLNEEIEAQTMCALAHGAQGLLGYIFQTTVDSSNIYRDMSHVYGLYGWINGAENGYRRVKNHYGQNKWAFIKKMNSKINNWIPTLDKINWQEGFSAHENVNHGYINDIRSIYRDLSGYFPDGPTCPNCDNVKYWEEGFFTPKDQNDRGKYFIMVNRRCVPEINEINLGDIRQLKIQFKPSDLPGFNNWILKDVNTGQTITFDKNNQGADGYLNMGNTPGSMGYFLPGEGKLFKLAPVMQEGGTFVCDEEVTATNFNCNGVVYNGGYDLLMNAQSGQTTVSFAPDANIQVENGGVIDLGRYNQVILKGQNGGKWKGLYFYNDNDQITVNYCKLEDIGDANNSAYWSLSMYNCPYIQITSSIFTPGLHSKAININNYSLDDMSPNIVITDNSITVKSVAAAVFAGCNAEAVNDLFFMNNTLINSEGESTAGVIFGNIIAFYFHNNYISGFNTGIQAMNSTLELGENNISAYNINSSRGVLATSGSILYMGNVGDVVYAGQNKIINKGNDCKNIQLDNAVFEMSYGSNSFEVYNTAGNFHLMGNGNFHPGDEYPVLFIYAEGNCFNGEGYFARDSVTELNGLRDSLLELPHYCQDQQDMIADFTVQLANNQTDTVYRSTLQNNQSGSLAKTTYKNLYKNSLKRHYDSIKIMAVNLLTNYSDSIYTPGVIQQLYLSVIKTDSTISGTQALKTFIEQLILSHPTNIRLVKSANYFVQKCKVRLSQYTSALDGFQDIIVQNPYSYEGLLASWDYAATLLLANSGGSYSDRNVDNLQSYITESEFLSDSTRLNRLLKNDKYDSKVFTKEDRKTLFISTGNVLKDERQKQTEKVKELEEKLTKSTGKENDAIRNTVEEMKNLNALIKTKRPKDKVEYAAIVNNDIEKMNPRKNTALTGKESSLPTTFELYQNYPNPFNPTTKIAFDLPKDAKIKLVIYDILGREVKTLINNEFRSAGKYISEFNGSSLASGIYFARILVNDGKDFIAVKKMVLIK